MSADRLTAGPGDVWHAVGAALDDGFCLCEIVLDPDGRPADYRVLAVNHAFQATTGLADATGRTALELVPDLERHWIETCGRVALDRVPLRFESGAAPMGRVFEAYAAPADPPGRFTVVFRDITRLRRLEAERAAALEQARELLLELNHRVKNSLGIIAAIIGMEAREREVGTGRRVLRRIEARLQAVAALYRELSRAGTAGSVNARDYLGGVLSALAESIGSEGRIGLDWQVAPVEIPTDMAVPLGLIVNELVTNSLKYAFGQGRSGRVSVTLAPDGAGHLLRVADDGSGMSGAPSSDSGLGERLVGAFVQSLGGTRTVETGPGGTTVTIRFQSDPPPEGWAGAPAASPESGSPPDPAPGR